MARSKAKADAALAVPPFYIATVDLFIGGDAGTMPVCAFRKGDRVNPAQVVEQGWQDQVELPEGYATPTDDDPADEQADEPEVESDTVQETEQGNAADDAAGKE